MTVKRGINKLNGAMDAMRRQDARLIQTFSYYGKPDYWISPAGCRVEEKIAEQVMAHPQIEGGKDALFPGHHQRGGCVRVTTGGGVVTKRRNRTPACGQSNSHWFLSLKINQRNARTNDDAGRTIAVTNYHPRPRDDKHCFVPAPTPTKIATA